MKPREKRVYFVDFANRTKVKVVGAWTRAEIEVDTTLGLLEMKKAGQLYAVHIHESRIEVEFMAEPGQKRPLTWRIAQAAVAKFRASIASPAEKVRRRA